MLSFHYICLETRHDMKTIDINRYVLSGAGANGESYDCLDERDVMLKLYNADYPMQTVIDELEIARKVYSMGVPSPEPGELVRCGERLGIRFHRIEGKRSFSRAVADEPERVGEYAREFAVYGKRLHSTVCPEGMFPSQKELYLRFLDADRLFDADEHDVMRRFIESMSDDMTAVHGDFHMGNILTTLPKRAPMSDPHDIFFIDVGYFAVGCPLLDVSMLYNICTYADEEFVQKEMHIGREVARKFWRSFVDEYFFGPENLGRKWFGEGVTPSEIDEKLIPYVAIKLLLVGFNAGEIPSGYMPVMKKALKLMA